LDHFESDFVVALAVAIVLAILAFVIRPVRSWVAGLFKQAARRRRRRREAPEMVERLTPLIEELVSFMTHLRDVTKAFRAADVSEEAVRERVRREILEPIRGYLPTLPGEQIKIVWFKPHADGVHLYMYEQVGHTEEGAAALRLRIGGSVAGRVYLDKEALYFGDCENAPLFQQVEQTKASGTLACVPILRGREAVGVLSVLSSCQDAFWLGEMTYLEALAAAIGSLEALQSADEDSPGSATKGTAE
jgi:GAF domain-containing protein